MKGCLPVYQTWDFSFPCTVRKEALLSSQIEGTQCTLEMSYNTVSKVVSILVDDGILEQTDKSGKAKIFSYTEYLDILRKDT
ncbi:hypothetical protein [Hominifimenecus microfluidus]|uniref:hypothetical protein n=1 Tax=Hominifimenecus microfluidus TaxID=2885348 RepID=UPI003D756534